ncbi:MAG: DUF167 domain-containing protein [Phycisphaerales bacterium JB043]
MSDLSSCVRAVGGGVEIRVKAVPGASRDDIAGVLGGRLKVRVSAPPEDGKANTAIIALLASRLGIKPAQIEIAGGRSRPEKTILVRDVDVERVIERLEG